LDVLGLGIGRGDGEVEDGGGLDGTPATAGREETHQREEDMGAAVPSFPAQVSLDSYQNWPLKLGLHTRKNRQRQFVPSRCSSTTRPRDAAFCSSRTTPAVSSSGSASCEEGQA
jgi:hypothetical protein